MMLHIARLLALGLSIVIATPAPAQPLTGVLKRIKDSGEITLGYRDASVPFSYLDDKQQPVGYSMDLCLRVVDAVKAELKLPALKVIYNPVTSANRIPLIANGTIELECGSTVNNVERQAQVAFSDTTFIVSTRFIAKRDGNLKTLADLRGKTVVCTAGTNTLARVNGLNQKQNLGMTILTGYRNLPSAIRRLLELVSPRARRQCFYDIATIHSKAAQSLDLGVAPAAQTDWDTRRPKQFSPG